MNSPSRKTKLKQNAAAIGTWENEGGAHQRDSMDHHYGRRIEPDGSWTLYHVFTGVPAHVGGEAMTDLSRSDATSSMLSLNHRNAERRKERGRLSAYDLDAGDISACRS